MASRGLDLELSESPSQEPLPDKRWRFHPFRSMRRLFAKKRGKPNKNEVTVVSVKSKSTSDMLEAQDSDSWKPRGISVPHNTGLSMSHDSIFTPDIHDDENERRMHETALSMQDMVTTSIRDELFKKIKMQQGSDDEDIGFPNSPPSGPTTIDILEQGLKVHQLAKSHSTCSDASLLSMGSSELDEEALNQSPSQQSSNHSLQAAVQNEGDDVSEPVPLQHDAAHHRIAIKPRNRRKSMGNRRQQKQNANSGNLPATPEVNEEFVKISAENQEENSQTVGSDSLIRSEVGLSPLSLHSESEEYLPKPLSEKNISDVNLISVSGKTSEISPNKTQNSSFNQPVLWHSSLQNLNVHNETKDVDVEHRKNQSFPYGQKLAYVEELTNEENYKKSTKYVAKKGRKSDGEITSNKEKGPKSFLSRLLSKSSFRKAKKNISNQNLENPETNEITQRTTLSEKVDNENSQSYFSVQPTKRFGFKSVFHTDKESNKKSEEVKRSVSVRKDDVFYRKKYADDANKNASIKSAPEFINETYSPRAKLTSSTWKEIKSGDNKFDEEGELYKVFARRSMKLKELELLENEESINGGDAGKTTNPLFQDDANIINREKSNSVLSRISLFETNTSQSDDNYLVNTSETISEQRKVSVNTFSQENHNVSQDTKSESNVIFLNNRLKQVEKTRPVTNVPTPENPYPTWVRVAKQKQKQREENVEKLEKEIQKRLISTKNYEDDNLEKGQNEEKEANTEKIHLTEESFLFEKLQPWEPKATEYIIHGSALEIGLPIPSPETYKPCQNMDKSRYHNSYPHCSSGSSGHQSKYPPPDIDFIDTYYKYKVYQV